MQPEGILETALYVNDLAEAERFYKNVLGLKVMVKEPNRHVFFKCGEGMLMLFDPRASSRPPVIGARMPVPPHGANGPGHVCFRAYSHEISQWITRLKAARVKIEADFNWPNGARSIYFRDPAGNSIEFAEPRIWPTG